MFQLSLDFLGRLGRMKAPRSPRIRTDHFLAWKHGITVHIAFVARARRYLLRLQADGTARLVIPRRGTEAEGIRFLERSEEWLLKRVGQWRQRDEARQSWIDGTRFLFRGEKVDLRVTNKENGVALYFADQSIFLSTPQADYRATIFGHLRRLAEQELPMRLCELALIHGIDVHRVSVRAQKTRWGSCSARGTISLNWRLIQAPPEVVDYLIIHELMHRQEMNHSARYWKLVAQACPDYRNAEQWLKKSRIEMA